MAYNNLNTNKMLFTLVAFVVFVVAEIVTLVDATWPTIYDLGVHDLVRARPCATTCYAWYVGNRSF